MTTPAAITAQLVDVRNVAAHKSVRLELHVPAEQAGLVMAAFGWPTMADPVPVALARLVAVAEPSAEPEPAKERRAFTDLPYAQQAAMRCQEVQYRNFISERFQTEWAAPAMNGKSPAEAAAVLVRRYCQVESRSEIAEANQAGRRWRDLEAEFYAWQRGRR